MIILSSFGFRSPIVAQKMNSYIFCPEDKKVLINATYGRRTRAVIIMDSGHVVLSSLQPETVSNRLSEKDDEETEDNEQR